MKITKTELKEMIREALREELYTAHKNLPFTLDAFITVVNEYPGGSLELGTATDSNGDLLYLYAGTDFYGKSFWVADSNEKLSKEFTSAAEAYEYINYINNNYSNADISLDTSALIN